MESQLDATYFDTADGRLARHHITLRRRTGGEDAGWHLKLPAAQDERTEVRQPLGRATRKVPAALAREVRALVRDRPLVPIAVLHTTRIERRLLDADGNALATVADDTVHGQRLGDGRRRSPRGARSRSSSSTGTGPSLTRSATGFAAQD